MKRALYVVALVALIGSHWWTYRQGERAEEARNNAAIIEARAREDKLLAELQTASAKREVIYRDRIKVVREIVDECLDRPLPPDLIDSLRPDPGPAVTRIDG